MMLSMWICLGEKVYGHVGSTNYGNAADRMHFNASIGQMKKGLLLQHLPYTCSLFSQLYGHSFYTLHSSILLHTNQYGIKAKCIVLLYTRKISWFLQQLKAPVAAYLENKPVW